jgi:hypothetical protein
MVRHLVFGVFIFLSSTSFITINLWGYRYRGGIGLSYLPARLNMLADPIPVLEFFNNLWGLGTEEE